MTIFARAAIVMILVATTALMLLLPSTHSVDRSPRTKTPVAVSPPSSQRELAEENASYHTAPDQP